jgi:copper(I)-binding protein
MKSTIIAFATCVIALGVSACSSDDDTGSAGSTVSITLQEDTVTASPASVPAGGVTFNVRNTGTEVHEFVIVKTDLAEEQLPMANGHVDETAAGMTVVDEIEDIPAGGSGTLNVQLATGQYVLICNVVEEAADGAVMANHYAEGMHTAFTAQ